MNRKTAALFGSLIVATACGDSGTTPPALVPTTVTVTPGTSALNAIGATGQLTARVLDQNGDALGAAVSWTSSASTVVSVNQSGSVTAVGEGVATITATAQNASGTATVSVATSPPTITGISPALWTEGGDATLTGTNFATVAAGNVVLVDGAPAVVISATATSIDLRVPVLCSVMNRSVVVDLTSHGLAAEERTHPVSPGAFAGVTVGQQTVLTDGGEVCLQFGEDVDPADYLLGVQSLSEDATLLNPVRLTSSIDPGSVAVPRLFLPSSQPVSTAAGRDLFVGPTMEALRDHRREESRFMAGEIGLVNRLMRAPHTATASRSGSRVPNLNIGQETTLKVRDFNGPQTCTQAADITATVLGKTPHSIWYVDNANPADGFTATEVQGMADDFENDIYAPATAMFGAPTDIDNNGRVAIVISQEINKTNGEEGRIQGFVSGCDFFQKSSAPDSNEGETFYLLAPDPTGSHGREISKDLVTEIFPFVVAHELTHIIQFGIRIELGSTVPEVYHLEGQATFAEEAVGHAVEGNTSGQNYGGDVAWDFDEVASARWYRGAFSDLVWWFGGKPSSEDQSSQRPGAPEQCTWLDDVDDPCTSRASYYGVTWSFLRWATDQFFAGNEPALQQALIRSGSVGFALYESAMGRPREAIFPPWAAALYLDDREAVDGSLTYTSWNLNNIYEGSPIVPTGRLIPRMRGFENFQDDVQVRAGSTAYWRVSGTSQARSAIKIRTQSGEPLPEHMVTWIVKIH